MTDKNQLTALADKLRRLSADMENIGSEMQNLGVFTRMELHGDELISASLLALQWAEEIEKGKVE